MEVVTADDGEVLCRGPIVFSGYLDDPERTAEALDADGWLHTGDIGEFDADGYLKIVDRKKELIITGGGKNVSPANVEAVLKTVPLVGQAMVVGDAKPYLVALLTLDPDAVASRYPGRAIADVAADPEVVAEIARGVANRNEALSRVERPRRIVVLGEEWLPDSDLLTPTMKAQAPRRTCPLRRRGRHDVRRWRDHRRSTQRRHPWPRRSLGLMFDTLSDRLDAVFTTLRGKGRLSDADIDATAREIRIALLEADVALPVVREFVDAVKERARGEEVSQALNPAQQVVKIVNDELVTILGGETRTLNLAKTPPTVVMLAGLQGTGKTTLAAKLGRWLEGAAARATARCGRPAAPERRATARDRRRAGRCRGVRA